MKQEIAAYPVIIEKCNDESGHYYAITSPNIQGLVTDGQTIGEALYHAEDAMATMIDLQGYPRVQDPTKWKLEKKQQISWVKVNMTKWRSKYSKTVRRNISLPEDLNNWAKKNKINVSKVTTEALRQMQAL